MINMQLAEIIRAELKPSDEFPIRTADAEGMNL